MPTHQRGIGSQEASGNHTRQTAKSKLDSYRPEIEALLNNGSTQKFIAQRYSTTAANLSRWLMKQGLRSLSS